MSVNGSHLHVLLVDDDPETLEQLALSLPKEMDGHLLEWEPCQSFEKAVELLGLRRFDIVVTDVYRDRKGVRKGINSEDEKARDLLSQIKNKRFCPMIAFSDGSAPETVRFGPFVKFADKAKGDQEIIARFKELLATNVPQIARKLHDELDRSAGSYLWDFLEQNWDAGVGGVFATPESLERIVRRRAALQLGRLDTQRTSNTEIESIHGAEFYIYPPISGDEYRLGEILKDRRTGEFRVLLTPHCHLTIQANAKAPRAEFVLTVRTVRASDLFSKHPLEAKKEVKRLDELRRRLQSPAGTLGQPDGRYWFLPGFLEMSNLYCDLLQLESVSFDSLRQDFDRFAVLDTPFAEALQSCFTRFYSAVGLPGLNPSLFSGLAPNEN